jgi:hypothetical protein
VTGRGGLDRNGVTIRLVLTTVTLRRLGLRWPFVALLLCSGLVVDNVKAQAIPAQLSDQEFWQLFVRTSEADGVFEDENYVSNELGYERTMQRLQDTVPRGGVFLGVGPEQNFHYIAALKPSIAFVIDIRRQNAIEHLMYKALFELADDRGDFLAKLFSRPKPDGLDATSDVDALFRAFATARPGKQLFAETLAGIEQVLIEGHRFPLDERDRAALAKVLTAFYEAGPDLMYVFRGTAEKHPTYTQMMTAKDAAGRAWSFLGTAEAFEYIRVKQRQNLIVPVVGDFAGTKALRAVGDYLREHGSRVDVLYASNVEPYLFGAGTWKAFYENVLALPVAESAIVIRSFFGSTVRECAALRPTIRTPVIGSIGPLLAAYRKGEIRSQCDVVTLSR